MSYVNLSKNDPVAAKLKIEIAEGFGPQLEIGAKVFFLIGGKREYVEDHIDSVGFKSIPEEDGCHRLAVTHYYLSNYSGLHGPISPARIADNEDIAKQLMKFTTVQITEEQWELAIGDREKETHYEDCELQSCCANISRIRDLLLLCKKQKGMNASDIEELKETISDHEKPSPMVALNSILQQLGVEWNE